MREPILQSLGNCTRNMGLNLKTYQQFSWVSLDWNCSYVSKLPGLQMRSSFDSFPPSAILLQFLHGLSQHFYWIQQTSRDTSSSMDQHQWPRDEFLACLFFQRIWWEPSQWSKGPRLGCSWLKSRAEVVYLWYTISFHCYLIWWTCFQIHLFGKRDTFLRWKAL